jgi:MFS family permease
MNRARVTGLLLNLGHALDHFFLLIFASAVAAIAADFGRDWQELMPYATGAFLLFGLGAAPAGRLGDLWGRRAMMLVFFFGMGGAALLASFSQSPWHLAAALTLIGAFAAIYHPVGIPMLVEGASRPGTRIGLNGLAGNLGIAAAALVTGWLVAIAGWRFAFVVPGLVCIAAGVAFALVAPVEHAPPAQRRRDLAAMPKAEAWRVFALMTAAATCSGIIFNLTTNANAQLLTARLGPPAADPALVGLLLALCYAAASLAQPLVGRLIDQAPLKPLYLSVVLALPLLFWLAADAHGWLLYALVVLQMLLVFGQIPFIDAISVRYFDDRVRSRVAGIRFAIAFGIGALAVWGLGPLVRAAGFEALFVLLAAIAAVMVALVLALPATTRSPTLAAPVAAAE